MSVAGDIVTAAADRNSNPGLKQWDGSAYPNQVLSQFDIDRDQFLKGIEIIQMFSVLAPQRHRAASDRHLVLAAAGGKLGDVDLVLVGFVGLIRHPAACWRNPRIPGSCQPTRHTLQVIDYQERLAIAAERQGFQL